MKRIEVKTMRNLKILIVGLLLAVPGLAPAEIGDVPGDTTWYLHIDFEQMRSESAGKGVYGWMVDEIFDDVNEDAGVDLENELDSLTGFSVEGQGPIFLFEGNVSQTSKDRLMALIAVEGNLNPLKSSGKSYYRFTDGGDDDDNDSVGFGSDNIEIQFDELENESWISMALDNKVLVTATEEQMKAMLKKGGKISGSRGHNGALLVLTADKPLVQAGMNSVALGEESDGESGWESNILRNTEQVAFLVAVAADKLAIEAKLITTEPDMATSLASVVRGLISLMSFSDDMDADIVALVQGTRIEADGRNLIISLAIDPEMIVSTLRDE
jgi:hypothetical protein